ncbi:MAG: SCP2 sterol-binding domain-containing protein [Ruminococcus sp.]|jgi:putative sterol carrier protein|nr:SCP2 sterol-binding domain-containing protein [Ruminococcus sp.]
MELTQLISYIKQKISGVDKANLPSDTIAFQFNVSDLGRFYVELKNKEINIEPHEYNDRDMLITINSTNLIKLIDGKLDPVKGFLMKKFKAEGDFSKVKILAELMKKR